MVDTTPHILPGARAAYLIDQSINTAALIERFFSASLNFLNFRVAARSRPGHQMSSVSRP